MWSPPRRSASARLNLLPLESRLVPTAVQLEYGAYTAAENGGYASVNIVLDAGSPDPVGVHYETADGTATEWSDYTPVYGGYVEFSPGQTSQTIYIPLTDDATYEGDETLTVYLYSPSGGDLGDLATATLTIQDDDAPPPVVQLEYTGYTAAENGGYVGVTVALDVASPSPVGVYYQTADGTATAWGDYTPASGSYLEFSPWQTSQTIYLPLYDDATYEGDEAFTLSLYSPSGATLGGLTTATLTIQEDDPAPPPPPPPPVVQFESGSFFVTEFGWNANITVVLDAASSNSVGVYFQTAGGTATTSSDYTPFSGYLEFSPGQTSQTIYVSIWDDTTYEGDETVGLSLYSPSGAVLGTSAATLTIQEDDPVPPPPPVVSFTSADYEVTEGGTQAVITVSLSGPSNGTVDVQFHTEAGTADGTDYTESGGSLSFSPGQTSASFVVPITQDGWYEPNETITLLLTSTSGAGLTSPSTATLTILDDDPAPTVSFSGSWYEVTEGAGQAIVTVVLNAAAAHEVMVHYGTTGGTATPGADYTGVSGSGTLTFAPGETTKTFYFYVATDLLIEQDETVGLELSEPTGVVLGTSTATLVIHDSVTTISYAAGGYLSWEGSGQAVIEVALSRPSPEAMTVNYSTTDGTASAGSDYTGVSGTLTFAPGETSKTFTVPVAADSLLEGDETVVLELFGASLGTSAATLVIRDDAASPTDTRVNTATANEQLHPRVGVAGDGSYVIVWVSYNQDGDGAGVYAQRYGDDGTPRGGEFRVNTHTVGAQYAPVVGVAQDGSFVIAWHSTDQDGDGFGVYAQRFGPDGSPLGGEFRVNTTTAGAQLYPCVGVAPNGAFVVVWHTYGIPQNEGATGTYAQLYAADGSPCGAELRLDTATTGQATSIGVANDASFIVTWQAFGPDGSGYGVYARRYAADGSPSGTTFQVNTTTTGFQWRPSVGVAADGSFVVVWQSDDQGSDIYAQRYGADDLPVGAEFRVNTAAANYQGEPDIGVAGDGSFVITWSGYGLDGDASGVHAQRYGADGTPLGTEFRVNTTATGGQSGAVVGMGAAGGFVVAWHSNGQDGDRGGVYMALYPAPGGAHTAASVSSPTVTEGDTGTTALSFTISLSASSWDPVTIDWSTADGTATTADGDYSGASGTVTFAPGETVRTVTVWVGGDRQYEPDETLHLNLSNPTGTTIGVGSGTGTVLNDDPLPAVSLSASTYHVAEASGTATVTVVLNRPSYAPVTVHYRSQDGTAATGTDYDAVEGDLVFAPGQTSATFLVTVVNDSDAESDETVALFLSAPSGATLAGSTATLTIADDDIPPPAVAFAVASAAVAETAGTAVVTVTLSAAAAQPVSVMYQLTPGSATAGADYAAQTGTLTFAPGQTVRTFSVTILNDTFWEGEEAFGAQLLAPTGGAVLGSLATTVLRIQDDEPTPKVEFASATYQGGEGTTATVMVRLSGPAAVPQTVAYSTSNGTAVAPGDYGAASGTLTFAPGQTLKTFTVVLADDTTFEGTEQLVLHLANPGGGAQLGERVEAPLAIQDNDAAPLVGFDVAAVSAVEGGAAAVVSVKLSAASNTPVTVQYASRNGTATAPGDYTAVSGTLTFAPGETSKSFLVPVGNDAVWEGSETVYLSLTSPTGGAVLAAASAVLTIADNQPAPTVEFTAATYFVAETDGFATITVRLTTPSATSVSVGYYSVNAAAVAPDDYAAVSGTLTFAPGETTRTFVVPVAADEVWEGMETVTLWLSNPSGAGYGGIYLASLRINDANPPPVVRIANSGLALLEDSAGTVVLTLSRPAGQPITVEYTTANGTALAPGDYDAVPWQQLTFAAGTTSQTVTLRALDDDLVEGNETFTFRLGWAYPVTFDDTPLVVTVLDDDLPVMSFDPPEVTASEAAGTAELVVRLDRASPVPVSVPYTTVGGTATAGADFTSAQGVLTFAPGVMVQTLTLTLANDTEAEADESFTVVFGDPTGAVLDQFQAEVVVRDEDSVPWVRVRPSTYRTPEGGGPVTVTLELSTPAAGVVTVAYATANQTATAGADYTAASGVVTFAPGETTATITVQPLEDDSAEAAETLAVVLSSPSGAQLSPGTATITLEDDDLIAAGVSATATQWRPFGGVIATVTTVDPSVVATGLGARIEWGDGAVTAGTVAAVSGGFEVRGAYAYPMPGPYLARVIVTHAGGAVARAASAVQVVASPLAVAPVTVAATEAAAFSGVVADFRTTRPGAAAADFSVQVDWGDGTSTTGAVQGDATDGFTVTGAHTYALLGSYAVRTRVVDTVSSDVGVGLAAADVADALLTASGRPVAAGVQGTETGGVVAAFTDANPAGTAADFAASVDWGDGAVTPGVVAQIGPGAYEVAATHAYVRPGNFVARATIWAVAPGTAVTSATTVVAVADAPLAASGVGFARRATSAFSGVVATFTDGNLLSAAADFTATINWGEGPVTGGTVERVGPGSFRVVGSHTYATPGDRVVAISVVGSDGGTATAQAVARITNSAAVVGVPHAFAATFADPTGPASAFAAAIDWGDGTTTAGTVTDAGAGQYVVAGSHTYAAVGAFTITATVTRAGATVVTLTDTVAVADAALVLAAPAVTATEGQQFNGQVATFAYPLAAPAASFAAVVEWEPGETTTGVVTALGGGQYRVAGSRTYHHAGSYPVRVTVTSPFGTESVGTGAATVADAALTATGVSVSAVRGALFTGAVAVLYDGNPFGSAADFTATIDWGDGTESDGTVVAAAGSGFEVWGSHRYAASGTTAAVVTIQSVAPGTATAAATSSVTIAPAALAVSGVDFDAGRSVALSGVVVATFTTEDADAEPDAFTATVDWGDGSTSDGGVEPDEAGGFRVTATHTYAAAGSFTVVVTVNGPGGVQGQGSGTARVAGLDATEGQPATGTVATFNRPGAAAEEFAATINWGDGETSAGTVTAAGGGAFTVTGTHTYRDVGYYPVSVEVQHNGGGLETLSGGVFVADAPLSAAVPPLSAVARVGTTGSVAAFTDANPYSTPDDFVAVIDWGDGTVTAGTISGGNGSFVVFGTHQYLLAGVRPVGVTVRDVDGGSATAAGLITVQQAGLVVLGRTVEVVEGSEYDDVVASFIDPDPSADPAWYTATIFWGDGTTSAGEVVDAGGGRFDVTGVKRYTAPGGYVVGVEVTQPGGPPGAGRSVALISDAPIQTNRQKVSQRVGENQPVLVATFTDGNEFSEVANFRARIDWGNGVRTDGVVERVGGVFRITGAYRYTTDGIYPVRVTLTDRGSGRVYRIQSTAVVADVAPVVTVLPVSVVEGQQFTQPVAAFTHPNPNRAAAQYLATIEWGDGVVSQGQVRALGYGKYTVVGTHVYAERRDGVYPGPNHALFEVKVTVDAFGEGISAPVNILLRGEDTGDAVVGDAGLVGMAKVVEAEQGKPYTRSVARFVDPNPFTPRQAFTAVIDWGDGSGPTAGVVRAFGEGIFEVTGPHTYATAHPQPYSVTVTITDVDGSTAVVRSLVRVIGEPLRGSGTNIDVTMGTEFTKTVATFTVGDPTLSAGDFTARVEWWASGDGEATVTGGGGSFAVIATGTYDRLYQNVYHNDWFRVILTGPDGEETVFEGSAYVTAAGFTVEVLPLTAVEASGDFYTVARVRSQNPNPSINDFSLATIDWGDGTSSWGNPYYYDFVEFAPGVYDLKAGHEYAQDGTYTLRVRVNDKWYTGVNDTWGGAVIAEGAATVVDKPETVWVGVVLEEATHIYANVPFTGRIARFAENPFDDIENYTATISWGDGTTSAGTIRFVNEAAGETAQYNPPHLGQPYPTVSALPWGLQWGFYEVLSGHTYTQSGWYTVTVTITDSEGSTTSNSGQVYADYLYYPPGPPGPPPPSLPLSGNDIEADEGVYNIYPVATYSFDGPVGAQVYKSAWIDWGDGTGVRVTNFPQLLENPPDPTVFRMDGNTIYAAHRYAVSGHFTIKISMYGSWFLPGPANGGEGEYYYASSTATAGAEIAPRTLVSAELDASVVLTDAVEYVELHEVEVATVTAKGLSHAELNAADYVAVIYWGDGKSSLGTIEQGTSAGGDTSFVIRGTHTYAGPGAHVLSVHFFEPVYPFVPRPGSAHVWAAGTVLVPDRPLPVATPNLVYAAGATQEHVYGTISDPEASLTLSDFTAVIKVNNHEYSGLHLVRVGESIQVVGPPLDLAPGWYRVRLIIRTNYYDADEFQFDIRVTAPAGTPAPPVVVTLPPLSKGPDGSGGNYKVRQVVTTAVAKVRVPTTMTKDGISVVIRWGDGTMTEGILGSETAIPGSPPMTEYQILPKDPKTYRYAGSAPLEVEVTCPCGITYVARGTAVIEPDDHVQVTGNTLVTSVSDWPHGYYSRAETYVRDWDLPSGRDVSLNQSSWEAATVVGVITDPDPDTLLHGYTATYEWGVAEVIRGEGNQLYVVVPELLFGMAGQFTGRVVVRKDNRIVGTALTHVTVTDTAAGVPTYIDTARFRNPNPFDPFYSAEVDWGDGTPHLIDHDGPGGTDSWSGAWETGYFSLTDTLVNHAPMFWGYWHPSLAYADPVEADQLEVMAAEHVFYTPGEVTITTTVTNLVHGGSATQSRSLVVGEAEVRAYGSRSTFYAAMGETQTGLVGTFADSNYLDGDDTSKYSALIVWGDGTAPEPAELVGHPNGTFSVRGTHLFARAGYFTAAVFLLRGQGAGTDPTGAVGGTTFQVDVAGTPWEVTATDLSAIRGRSTGRVKLGEVRSSYAPGTPTVFIHWGVGNETLGEVVAGDTPGTFLVFGETTYGDVGLYEVKLRVGDRVARGTATVVALLPGNGTADGLIRANDPDHALLISVGGAVVSANTGAVRLAHQLDFDLSPGTEVGGSPALVYNSDTASVRPIVELSFTLPLPETWGGAALDTRVDKIEVELFWEAANGVLKPAGKREFLPGPDSLRTRVLVSMMLDSPVTRSGFYSWKAVVTVHYTSGGQSSAVQYLSKGETPVVVQSGPVGSGWGIAGVDRVVVQDCDPSPSPGSILVAYGTGDYRVFTRQTSGNYTNPEDFGWFAYDPATGALIYTATDRTRRVFDTAGRLVQVIDRHGLAITYGYAPDGRLNLVTAPDGGVTQFVYANGTVTILEPGARTVTLTVSETGELLSIADPVDPVGAGLDPNPGPAVRTFGYTAGKLTQDTWAPHQTTFTYLFGRVSEVRRGADPATVIVPVAVRGLTAGNGPGAITAPTAVAVFDEPDQPGAERYVAYTLDGSGRAVRADSRVALYDAEGAAATTTVAVETWARNAAGQVTTYTDALNRTTQYVYGSAGVLRKVTNPDGTWRSYDYHSVYHFVTREQDEAGKVTNYTYSSATGDLLTVRDALGNETVNVWANGLLQTTRDPLNRVTAFAYDANRRLRTTTDALGGVTTYSYDAAGNLRTVINARGYTTATVYDGRNLLRETINAEGGRTRFTYYADGSLGRVIDPRGAVTSHTYDARGWRTQTVEALGRPEARRTNWDYDAVGNVITVTAGRAVSADIPDYDRPSVTTFAYDALGNRTGMTEAAGADGERRTTFVYDRAGQLRRTISPLGVAEKYDYDVRGRRTAAYQGWQVTGESSIDGIVFDRATRWEYDAVGNVMTVYAGISRDRPHPGEIDDPEAPPVLDRPVDPHTTETWYLYDDLHRLIEVREAVGLPESRITRTYYDKVGNVVRVVSGLPTEDSAPGYARPVEATFEYDALNRLKVKTEAKGTPDQRRTTYAYDAVGNLVGEIDARGRETHYGYDRANRKTAVWEGVTDWSFDMILFDRASYYEYDPAGNLVTFTTGLSTNYESRPSVTTFAYDFLGRQTGTTDGATTPLARRTTTRYDAADNVTLIVSGESPTTTDPVTGLQYARPVSTRFEYNALNQRVRTYEDWRPNGSFANLTEEWYDKGGSLITRITGKATGRPAEWASTTYYRYDRLGQLVGQFQGASNWAGGDGQFLRGTVFQYDSTGNRTVMLTGLRFGSVGGYATSDSFARTEYEYDALGRVTERREGLGPRGSASTRRTTTFAYDAQGNTVGTTDVGGIETRYRYDSLNRLREAAEGYTVRGKAGVTTPRVTTREYDAADNVLRERDARGVYTHYQYDSLDRRVAIYEGSRTKDKPGAYLRLTTHVYDADDNVVSSTTGTSNAWGVESAPVTTLMTYDVHRRLIRLTEAAGTADERVTITEYDAANNVVATADGRAGGSRTDARYRTRYDYDNRGHRTAVTGPDGYKTEVRYDSRGNPWVTVDALGKLTTYTYDALSQVRRVERPQADTLFKPTAENKIPDTELFSLVTQFGYDAAGNRNAQYDGPDDFGGTLAYALKRTNYDILGRVTGETTRGVNNGTASRYDVRGNVVWLIDPNTTVTVFTYDEQGRRTAEWSTVRTYFPALGLNRDQTVATQFTYNPDGTLQSITDRLGRVRTFRYDDLNRQTGETWGWRGSDEVTETVTFTYDARGNRLTAANATGTVRFEYDALNRVHKETQVTGVTLTSTYDLAGNRTLMVDSLGGRMTSEFDAMNRLEARYISGWPGERIGFTQEWTARGEVKLRAAGTAELVEGRYRLTPGGRWTTTTYQYDTNGRVHWLEQEVDKGPAPGKRETRYEYGPTGKLALEAWNTNFADPSENKIVPYKYDTAGQVTAGSGATYQYNGIRREKAKVEESYRDFVEYEYEYGWGNELLKDGHYKYTYDLEGNRKSKDQIEVERIDGVRQFKEWGYEYDHLNRLTQVRERNGLTSAFVTERFRYDALGRLVYSTTVEQVSARGWNNTTRRFVHDGADVYLDLGGHIGQAPMFVARYLRGDKADDLVARTDANTTRWYLTDRLGSVRNVITATQLVSYSYDAFGTRRVVAVKDKWAHDITAPLWERYGYTGREQDALSGLQYNRSRWYDPRSGSWMGQDPIGFAGGDANLYRYVGNDPVNNTDPSGRALNLVAAGIGAGVGAIIGGGIGFVQEYLETGSLSLAASAAKRGAVAGAVTGGVAGLTMGGSLVVSGAGMALRTVAGAGMGSAAAQGTEMALGWRDEFSLTEVGLSMASAGAGFGVSRLVGTGVTPLRCVPGTAQPAIKLTAAAALGHRAVSAAHGAASHFVGDAITQNAAIAVGLQQDWNWAQSIGMTVVGAVAHFRLSRACFAAGTPLRTPDGWRAIESFRVGDVLLSRDEHDPTGAVEAKAVEEVFVRTGQVWYLHVGGVVIRTTAEHPFYAQGRGWVNCGELTVGERVLCEDGSWAVVEDLLDTGEWDTVYNLRVAEWHTYFVGCAEWGFSVWAHNADYTLNPKNGGPELSNTAARFQAITIWKKVEGRAGPITREDVALFSRQERVAINADKSITVTFDDKAVIGDHLKVLGIPDDAYLTLSAGKVSSIVEHGIHPTKFSVSGTGSFWVKAGEVAHLTPSEFRIGVVAADAGSSSSRAITFAVKSPAENNATLLRKYNMERGPAGVQEYTSNVPVQPDFYFLVPRTGK